MTSSDEQWMCQVQRDRLVINWRKRSEQYPRFSSTWTRFREAWRHWQEFLAGMNIPPAAARLWELTYVNRIPKQDLWECPSDWPKIFPGLWGGDFASVEGSGLRGLHGQWVWESTEPVAKLYVEQKPARSTDKPPQDVLLLTLTARGPVIPVDGGEQTDEAAISDLIARGMGYGHILIVTQFDMIASDEARKVWGRHVDVD